MQAFWSIFKKKEDNAHQATSRDMIRAVEHCKKNAEKADESLVGDIVTAVAWEDTVLAHAHLVLDGDTTRGTAIAGERVEMGSASRAHCFQVVVVYRQDNFLSDFHGTCQVIGHGSI
jgi:hypothetical protein